MGSQLIKEEEIPESIKEEIPESIKEENPIIMWDGTGPYGLWDSEIVNQNFEVNIENLTVTKEVESQTHLISTCEHLISTYKNNELYEIWCKLGSDLKLFQRHQKKIGKDINIKTKKLNFLTNEIEKCENRLKEEADLSTRLANARKENAELKKKKEAIVKAQKEKEKEEEKSIVVWDEKIFIKSLINQPIIFTPLDSTDENLNKLGESLNMCLIKIKHLDKASLFYYYQTGEILEKMKTKFPSQTKFLNYISKTNICLKKSTINSIIKFYKLCVKYPILVKSNWNYTRIRNNFPQIEIALQKYSANLLLPLEKIIENLENNHLDNMKKRDLLTSGNISEMEASGMGPSEIRDTMVREIEWNQFE